MNMRKYIASVICVLLVISCSKDDISDIPEEPDIDYEALSEKSVDCFLEFAKTPRPCLYLDKAREYLKKWCEDNGFSFNRDTYGNVWFDVPASEGRESCPNIILQGHMDMICVSEPGLNPDFSREVGTPVWDGTLLRGAGINLGSDNGIGVGIALTIAASDIPHGPLRILITADEDCGMLGANALPAEVLNADYLINVDQEDFGVINNGCGGGIRFYYSSDFEKVSLHGDEVGIGIQLEGLKGGHSGEDIGKGRLSAATVLNGLLDSAVIPFHGKLISIGCGYATNAIADALSLTFSVSGDDASRVKDNCIEQLSEYRRDYPQESFTYTLSDLSIGGNDYPIPERGSGILSELFKAIPTGAFEFSDEDTLHVTKSNNIGIVALENGHLDFQTFTRSDYNDWIAEQKEYYKKLADDYSLEYTIASDNPAWTPRKDNRLEDLTLKCYRQYVPDACSYPCMGGLEPAIFNQKAPDMQMVSIGPQISGAHTIDETLHTETVKPLLQTLIQVLMNADELITIPQ